MTTPLHETLDSATLLRFIDGSATAEERARVERWMAASEPNRREFARLTRAWEITGRSPEAMPDTSAMWDRIAPMLSEPPQRGTATDADGANIARRPLVLMRAASRSRWLSGPSPLLAAAGVLLAVGLVFRDAVLAGDDDAAAPGRTYTTRPGERAELRLADGSRVVLGGGTTLRIPESVPAS